MLPHVGQTRASTGAETVRELQLYIEHHADEPITLHDLAKRANWSPHHLQRRFKELVGLSPSQYHAACRNRAFQERLRSEPSVTSAVYSAGYGSGSRAYEKSAERLGMTPGQFRHGGRGVAISWAALETQLGQVVLGATDRGLCFLSLGDDCRALVSDLHVRFPRATISEVQSESNEQLRLWRRLLDDYLSGLSRQLPLPLDVQGTAFQTLVWNYLSQIPYGQTRTYAEVAAGIHRPSAVRAVANACGQNAVSLVIPCHRVIRSDGGLGGYRWGLERKRHLLKMESAATARTSKDEG